MDVQHMLHKFRETNRRSPRVLHIGNIANNAYNNAKLLNEIGFDCDVICPNYYHIMGCPEWEDAWIDEPVEDHFSPDWTAVNLNGFERPKWFVQGPLGLCIRYLNAKNSENFTLTESYWHILQCLNGNAKAGMRDKLYFMLWDAIGFLDRLFLHLVTNPAGTIRKILRRLCFDKFRKRVPPMSRRILQSMTGALLFFARFSRKCVLAFLHRFYHRGEKGRDYIKILGRIHERHERLFGNRNQAINILSLIPMLQNLDSWQHLFKQYDIIQGYATDPIYPYLAGMRYFAFEHGTLRSLPFDGTVMGSLTALAFSDAEQIFVTNTDCVQNAHRLADDRVTVIPHPFDERRMENVGDWKSQRQELQRKTGADYLIFYPTRHDWIEGQGYADKANDRLLRSFAALRENGCNVALICCRWGHNIEESAELLRELGCEEFVLWYEPMCVVRYEQMIMACDVVADQYLLGAFGGVTFRGLAAGRPVCTYLNDEEVAAAYGSVPPVVNCHTEDEILQALTRLFEDPEYRRRVGEESVEWIRKYHSGLETARTQARFYLEFLSSRMEQANDQPDIEYDRLTSEGAS